MRQWNYIKEVFSKNRLVRDEDKYYSRNRKQSILYASIGFGGFFFFAIISQII